MFILHYQGAGHGFMNGVSEYIVLTQGRPTPDEREAHQASGFTLYQTLEADITDGDEDMLPADRPLLVRM